MPTCIDCAARDAKPYGSGPYQRSDLCVGCFYDWFQAKTKAEDCLKDAARRAENSQARPHAATVGEPGATPTWRPGRNVAVREKACDRCGALISIRKNQAGKHYPADHDSPRPHRCAAVTS